MSKGTFGKRSDESILESGEGGGSSHTAGCQLSLRFGELLSRTFGSFG